MIDSMKHTAAKAVSLWWAIKTFQITETFRFFGRRERVEICLLFDFLLQLQSKLTVRMYCNWCTEGIFELSHRHCLRRGNSIIFRDVIMVERLMLLNKGTSKLSLLSLSKRDILIIRPFYKTFVQLRFKISLLLFADLIQSSNAYSGKQIQIPEGM